MMFEKFKTPKLYFTMQALLALYASGRLSGMVVDCGASKIHTVPIYEGYTLPHGIICMELAGQNLDSYMQNLLKSRNINVSMETAAQIKEKVGVVVIDPNNPNVQAQNLKLPDGKSISVGLERWKCPEALIQPHLLGKNAAGIHETSYNRWVASV